MVGSKRGVLNPSSLWLGIAGIAVLAFLMRLVPLLQTGALSGFRGYDDGVHYAAGVHLLSGSVPYRDFVLVHPPGIAVLMVPFAFLGDMTSDFVGVAAARLFFVLLGTLNAVLIGVLLKRWGALAVVAGAGLYAVWAIATIAERSIMLSPIVNTCVLLALVALSRNSGRPNRAVAIAATFLGLALCLKLWAILPIIVIAMMVAARLGMRLMLRFFAFGTAVCLVVMGPFFAMAPSEMFRDVVLVQLVRRDGAVKGLMLRLDDFAAMDSVGWASLAVAGLGVLCITLAALSGLSAGRRPREWQDQFWWALLAALIVGALMLSASFFDHYPNFAAPYLALCLGAAEGSFAQWRRRARRLRGAPKQPGRASASIAVLVVSALLIPAGVRGFVLEPVPRPSAERGLLAGAVGPYDCVFAPYAYMNLMSDSLSRSMRNGCGSIVDAFGARMVEDMNESDGGQEIAETVQDQQLAQLQNAQAAIVGAPHSLFGLSEAASELLTTEFVRTVTSEPFEIWVRK